MYGIACALAAEIGALASSDTLSHGDKIRVVLWPRNNQSPIERVTIVESPPSSDLAPFAGEIIKFEIVRYEDGTNARIDRQGTVVGSWSKGSQCKSLSFWLTPNMPFPMPSTEATSARSSVRRF